MRTVLCAGNIVITAVTDSRWEISAVSMEYLDWLRETYGSHEGTKWTVGYCSGSITLCYVSDEEIITMTLLRWS